MNPHVEQLAIPYQRSMMFLSYIRGPLVDDWVEEQAQWLINQVTGGVLLRIWPHVIDRQQDAQERHAQKNGSRMRTASRRQ